MSKKTKLAILILALFILSIVAGLYLFRSSLIKKFFAPTPTNTEQGIKSQDVLSLPKVESTTKEDPVKDIDVIAQDLFVPWEIVSFPGGDIVVTQRNGSIKKINGDGAVFKIEGVYPIGEGGLLGMAVHPDFAKNAWVYIYLTTNIGGKATNQVERYVFNGTSFSDKKVILSGIPADSNHNGGRIAFGPDRYLYITTGDAGNSSQAQNLNSLSGKILRTRDDGSIPSDNPFGTAVWSYGHRNPQGIVWDETGRMWETEHGRSGASSGLDELNLIVKGGNYGWPTIQGDQTIAGMITPVINSGANETWAPAGITYYDGSLFFTGLRGQSLYEAKLDFQSGKVTSLRSHFSQEYGRLRALILGLDGFFYLSTSNQDGRGSVNEGDDKVIKINPKIFRK